MGWSIAAGVKSRIRHSPIFPFLRRRRFHAYCVGGPKTGTTSIAGVFRDGYRTAHEPLHAGTMDYVLAAHATAKSRDELVRYLRWRDRELYLEMESSHPIAVFTSLLVDLFPESKFILTVREPRAWIDSIINQQLNGRLHRQLVGSHGPRAEFFPALQDYLCEDGRRRYSPDERVLEERGLYSLDGYLSWWASHNRKIIESVPHERLLVLRTERLSREMGRIAEFIGVPALSLDGESKHSNQAPRRHDLLDHIDPTLVAEKIEHHCREVCRLIESVEPARPVEMLASFPE